MEILKTFITNIILFILLGQILDLLLPSSSLRKYSKLVTGLLLLTLMLSPIAQLFQADWVTQIEKSLSWTEIQNHSELETAIAMKKSEINRNQRAYILEQMAVQLKSDAIEELMQNHQMQITQIDIKMKDDSSELQAENIQEIRVALEKNTNNGQTVKPIVIDFGETPKANDETKEEIAAWLAERWQLNKQIIVVKMNEDDSS